MKIINWIVENRLSFFWGGFIAMIAAWIYGAVFLVFSVEENFVPSEDGVFKFLFVLGILSFLLGSVLCISFSSLWEENKKVQKDPLQNEPAPREVPNSTETPKITMIQISPRPDNKGITPENFDTAPLIVASPLSFYVSLFRIYELEGEEFADEFFEISPDQIPLLQKALQVMASENWENWKEAEIRPDGSHFKTVIRTKWKPEEES